jgi:hypothetical protein
MIIELLQGIVQTFEKKEIPYMLTGSLALNVYSIPRMTLDIDIVIELEESNLENFISIFRDGFYLDVQTIRNETKLRGMFNIIDHKTGFKIDFILRKNTEFRKLEFSRRNRKEIAGFEAWLVSPEDLIISKIEWIQQLQSDKQMGDIEKLLAIPDIDKEYLSYWCNTLRLNTFDLF